VTPIGIGREAFTFGLKAGVSAVKRISVFDPSPFTSRIAAEITNFQPEDYIEKKLVRRLDRYAQFAVTAARLALADAGLTVSAAEAGRTGICIGSALGGIAKAEEELMAFNAGGIHAVNPLLATAVFCGSAGCNIAIDTGITGPVSANSNSCASGTIALGEALEHIRRDRADIVLAGGAEAPLSALCFGAFTRIRAMSCRNDRPEKACRPFDALRDGFVMGEGAAVMVVEELEHALARRAEIYGEIAGYALTNDAYHITAPQPDGCSAAETMRLAVLDAGLSPGDIEYINAHGSSTPLNDRTETAAIKRTFGDYARSIPISATKGHHGHALGAAGAIEAAACALTIREGYIPPTLNLENPDPECDLSHITGRGEFRRVETVLSNSFGFGGINACVVMRRYHD